MVGMRALLPLANATAIHAHWGYANALLAQARTNVRIARVLAILSTCAAADDVLRELRLNQLTRCTGIQRRYARFLGASHWIRYNIVLYMERCTLMLRAGRCSSGKA